MMATLLPHSWDRVPETATSVHMLIGQVELGPSLRELISHLATSSYSSHDTAAKMQQVTSQGPTG